MEETKKKKPKIYELARQHGYKTHLFLDLLKSGGFELTNSNQSVDKDMEEQINSFVEDMKEENTDFVGIMFDPRKKKYYPCTVKLHPKDFEELDVKIIEEHRTVFNAAKTMDKLITEARFFQKNPLERKIERVDFQKQRGSNGNK